MDPFTPAASIWYYILRDVLIINNVLTKILKVIVPNGLDNSSSNTLLTLSDDFRVGRL